MCKANYHKLNRVDYDYEVQALPYHVYSACPFSDWPRRGLDKGAWVAKSVNADPQWVGEKKEMNSAAQSTVCCLVAT